MKAFAGALLLLSITSVMDAQPCPTKPPGYVYIRFAGTTSHCLPNANPCVFGEVISFRLSTYGASDYLPQECDAVSWDFGDGSLVSTDRDPQHIYASPGAYPVRVTITNALGSTTSGGEGTAVVKVGDTLPCPIYEPSQKIYATATCAGVTSTVVSCKVGEAVHFETVYPADAPAQPCDRYSWDFADGKKATDRAPEHAFVSQGRYIVTVTVKNGAGGNAYGYAAVTVTPAPKRRAVRR